MDMTRKRFLQSLAGSTMAVLIQGCGGGGGYGGTPAPAPTPTPTPSPSPTPTPSPPPPAPSATCGASGSAIAGNHGHQLIVPAADRDSMVAMTYHIQGTADHDHTVTLSAAQLASLKTAGTTVVVESSDAGHTHQVTVSCI